MGEEHHHRHHHRHHSGLSDRSASHSHSSGHRHLDYSTTGSYRTGEADVTPIHIDGMDETDRDDRLDLHTFDPSAHHTHTERSEERRLALHKKNMRRKFRQRFLKILLICIGCVAALVLLWVFVSTFGKAKAPTPGNPILPAEGTAEVTVSSELPY